MSINAEIALDNMNLGSSLLLSDEKIAEIINKTEHHFEIKDTHGKHWILHREKLRSSNFTDFLQELTEVIDHYWHAHETQRAAQEVLSKIPLNASLNYENEFLANLISIEGGENSDRVLTFEDRDGNMQTVDLEQLPRNIRYADFLYSLKAKFDQPADRSIDSILMRYFKEEFVPMMIEQMKYDQQRLGDTWLMKPSEDFEKQIQKRFDEYFQMYEQDGKDIPWLKIAGYAIVAQARNDHPEWLL